MRQTTDDKAIIKANGVTITRGYSQVTGLAQSLEATKGDITVAQYTYDFDGFGNLHTREDVLHGAATETEHYDELNRLTKSVLNLAGGGGGTTTYTYDDAGNLKSRSDRGTYSYGEGGAGPHAVTSISDGSSFSYNENGEMLTDGERTLAWQDFGQVASITQGATVVSLDYDAENQRFQKTVSGATEETVLYLGAAERLTVNGQASIRRTLSLADLTIVDTGGANAQMRFVASDPLGSAVALTQSNGGTRSLSYGPFGRRMTAGWAGSMSPADALTINTTESDRGYTGQEGLDAVGLWDYNARLYDPALGRFLSVDPLIAHPESTQGINPYSYVENNPLNKIDPTGEAGVCSGGGMQDICNLNTSDLKSLSINSDGSVTAQLTNGSTMSSAAGAMGADTIAASAAGAAARFGPSTVNYGNLSNMIKGLDPSMASDHTKISSSNVKAANMAALSACSYSPSCTTMGHWNRTTGGISGSEFEDPGSGFRAALFKNGSQYALAFAGSNPIMGKDGLASAEQMVGFRSQQFEDAKLLTGDVLHAPGVANNLMLTGHSLGGALASLSALIYHVPADTFNAEGLSVFTLARYHVLGAAYSADSYITAYRNAIDPVLGWQRFDPFIKVPGRPVTLGGAGHSISSMCKELGTQC